MSTFVSNKKRIAKNTMFLYMRMLFSMIVGLYTSRIILQTLGVSDYGVYNVVGGIVLMMAFITGPLNGTTMRFMTYELGRNDFNRLSRIFACTLNIHIFVGIIMILLAESVGLWFLLEKMVIPKERMWVALWVYQFSIITMFLNFTQIPYSSSITAHENMKIYAYVGLYEAISKLIIVYLIRYFTWDKLWLYAFLIMMNRVGIVLFYRVYTRFKYKECKFHLFWDRKLYKGIISYAGWNIFGGLAVVSEGQGVNMLLNFFFGPVVNAARAVSYQVEGAIRNLVSNFLMAVRPQIVKNFANGNYDEMYRLTFDTTKYSFFLMYIFVLPIVFELDTILYIWLGDVIPPYTKSFTIVILATSLINTVDQSLLMSFHAIGKVRFGNIVGGIFMMLTIPLGYMSFKLGGKPVSVFIIVLIINMLSVIFDFFLINHYIPFSIRNFIKRTFIPIISVVLFSLFIPYLIISVLPPSIYRLIMNLILTFIYVFLLIWFLGLSSKDRNLLIIMLKKKFKLSIGNSNKN